MSVLKKVAIVCSLGLSGTLVGTMASAQKTAETCAGVEVQSVVASAELERTAPLDPIPEIKIMPAEASGTTLAAAGKTVKLIAFGPVLGSMDSHEIKTEVACTAKGFVLTASITRSADFNGSALKNVLWRPKIEVAVIPRQPDVIFEVTWVMRLTTGAEVDHAQTPSYPDQKYPITVTKTIR